MSIKLSNIRIHEAADYLGVSTKTLRRWEKSGKLPALRSEGNQRYYTKEQLDNFKSGIIPRALPTTHHLLSTVGFVLTWSMLFAPFGMGSLAIYKHINSNQKPSVLADAKINQPSVLAASDGDYTFNVNIPANFTDSVIFKKNITAPNVVYTFNGESGDINFELTGGDGITIEGSKITNSGIIELSAGDGISVDGNKITNTLVIPTPDYTLSGWTDSGTTVGLSTTTDSVVMDTVTFGNATVTNGKSIRPSNDLGSDLGSSGLRFNNLWVANINSNSSQSFSGQTTFSYPPTDTTISQASVLINPTTSVANGQLLGFGIAGFQRALVDAEGDMVLGYNSLTSAPATSYPLTIYGHNGTNVAYVDTSGNGYFAGNVNIAGLTASSAVYTDSSKNLTSTVPTSGALGYWTRSGTNLYNTTLTDNVGIGTTAPGALLDVKGNGQFGAAGDTQVIVRNRAIDIASANTGIYATTLNGLSALTLRSVSSTYPNILIYPNSTGNIILGHDGTNPVGKVGIGTTSPGTKLDVVGDIRATGASGTITSSVSMNTEAYYVSGAAALSYSTTDLKVGNNAFWQSIGLYTNGTRKVTIDSSGNVGIGTTAPGSKLDITVASAGNALQITNSSAATNKSWIMYPVTNGSSTDLRFYDTSDKMTLQAGGKVGIGTTNPTYKLEVNDTIGGTKAESDTIVYTNAAFTGNGAWWWLQGNTAHALNFGVYNSGSSLAAMTITQTGLVGIGTTSPTVKLQITDSARTPGLMLEAPDGAADRETITFRSSFSSTTHDGSISTSWYSAPVGMTFTSPRDETLGAFRFNSNGGTTRLYIDTTTGNVGIGTTAPISKLHVTGAVTGKALAIFDETGDQALLTASASGTTKFIIDHSGNVGIGTTNPATTLDVTGNVQASGVFQIKTTSQTFLQLKKSGTLDGEVYSNTGNLILQTSTAGNVGIGTTAPSNRLHVYTTTNADGLSVDGTSNPAIILRSSGVIKGYAPAIITSAGGFFNDSSVGDLAFRSESNKILLGVGSGASTLAISGSNVGIGTTAPGALLEIKGTTPTIIVRDSVDGILGQIGNADNLDPIGGTAGNFTIKYINNLGIANGTVRAMYFSSTGLIGIGTNSPTNILSLDGTAARTIWMERNTTAATAGQGLTITSGGAIAGTADLAGGDLTIKSGISTGTGTSALHFYTATAGSTGTSDNAATEKMTILGSGNVGIGTTNPTNLLKLNSNAPVIEIADNNTTIGYIGNSDEFMSGGVANDFAFRATNNMIFGIGTVEKMRISSAGNVGIGTTAPTSKLHVTGAVVGKALAIFNETGDQALLTASASGTTKFTIDHSGNVGIGIAPTYALDVLASGTGVIARFNSANSTGCSLATDGTISCTSDRTLKKNIDTINYGLAEVMKLNPSAFNWNFDSDDHTKSLGFIAQDVEQIIPGLVTVQSNGLRTLNTIGFIPVLTKAIQEQERNLQNLIARIDKFAEEIFTKKLHTEELCVGTKDNETCLNKDQVDNLMKLVPSPTPTVQPSPEASPSPSPEPTTSPSATPQPSPEATAGEATATP